MIRPQHARSRGLLVRARAPGRDVANDFRQPRHIPFPAWGHSLSFLGWPALNDSPRASGVLPFLFWAARTICRSGPTKNHVTWALFEKFPK